MEKYDENKHELLNQIAHSFLLTEEEWGEFVDRAREVVEVFDVSVPDWPPVPYKPLVLMMGPGDKSMWWDDKFFKGTQPAFRKSRYDRTQVVDIAKEMRGNEWSPKRVSYTWGVPEFDPRKHVPIREWINARNLDIGKFFIEYFPRIKREMGNDILYEVTTPNLEQLVSEGQSYNPTIKVLDISNIDILESFAKDIPYVVKRPKIKESHGINEDKITRPRDDRRNARNTISVSMIDTINDVNLRVFPSNDPVLVEENNSCGILADVGELNVSSVQFMLQGPSSGDVFQKVENVAPYSLYGDSGGKCHGELFQRGTYTLVVNAYSGKKASGEIVETFKTTFMIDMKEKSKVVDEITDTTFDDEEQDDITLNLTVYSKRDVMEAIRRKAGKMPRLFSGTTTDSAIVALTRKGMELYLKQNETNRMKYINDTGNRNFDCDDFAEMLRCDLRSKYGINGIAVVAGDEHAFNMFIIESSSGPEVVFVEPQTDQIVNSLSGFYSISHRFELLL